MAAWPEQKFNGGYEKSNDVCDERALCRDESAHRKDKLPEKLRDFQGAAMGGQGASEMIEVL